MSNRVRRNFDLIPTLLIVIWCIEAAGHTRTGVESMRMADGQFDRADGMAEAQQDPHGTAKDTRVVKVLALCTLLVVIVLLALWIDKTQLSKQARQSRELERNQAKWQSQHITYYRMELSYVGYGIEGEYEQMPLTVEVKNDQVVSAVDAQGNSWTPDSRPMTVPALFAFASEEIRNAADVYIEYDAALGYPTTIYVTPYTEPCCQEYSYSAQDLHVLP